MGFIDWISDHLLPPPYPPTPCPECQGRGHIPIYKNREVVDSFTCWKCRGTGQA